MSRPYFKVALTDAAAAAVLLGALIPFEGVLARRLGATPELLMLLSTAPFIGLLLATFLSRLSTFFTLGSILLVMTILGRSSMLLMRTVNSALGFVAIMVIFHILTDSALAMHGSLLKTHVPPKVQPNTLKWMRVTTVALAAPTAWFVGRYFDAHNHGYQTLLPSVGLLTAPFAIGYAFLPGRRAQDRLLSNRFGLLEEITVLRKDTRFGLFMLALFIGTLGEKIGLPVTPIYFTDVLNLRYSQVAAAIGIAGPALAVIGYFLWSASLKKNHPLTILTVAMFIKAVRPVLWALAAGSPHSTALIIVGEAVFRFSIAGIDIAVLVVILGMCTKEKAPLYIGIHCLLMGIRGILGPILGTALLKMDISIVLIYWLTAAIVTAGGIALAIFRSHFKP